MKASIREILEKVERGELDSQSAINDIAAEREASVEEEPQFLNVRVSRLHDHQSRVNVRIPFRWIELGLSIGARYAPELSDLDIRQLFEGFHDVGEGTIVEVEDLEEDEHVLISIESDEAKER